jgi:hypothetical protein
VAHVIGSEVTLTGKQAEDAMQMVALARATFDRQADVYKLAMMGNADCRRMWNDFERVSPGPARVVKRSVEIDEAFAAKACDQVDKRLRHAEMLTKAQEPKAKKTAKAKVRKSAPVNTAHQAAFDAIPQGVRGYLASDNPAEREMARNWLGL